MNSKVEQGLFGADLSDTDILATLFFRLLRYDKNNPQDPKRDRCVLSKGYSVGRFYCTLAQAGLLNDSLLDAYLIFDFKFTGHPVVRQKNDFVEVNTGGLAHGLHENYDNHERMRGAIYRKSIL